MVMSVVGRLAYLLAEIVLGLDILLWYTEAESKLVRVLLAGTAKPQVLGFKMDGELAGLVVLGMLGSGVKLVGFWYSKLLVMLPLL